MEYLDYFDYNFFLRTHPETFTRRFPPPNMLKFTRLNNYPQYKRTLSITQEENVLRAVRINTNEVLKQFDKCEFKTNGRYWQIYSAIERGTERGTEKSVIVKVSRYLFKNEYVNEMEIDGLILDKDLFAKNTRIWFNGILHVAVMEEYEYDLMNFLYNKEPTYEQITFVISNVCKALKILHSMGYAHLNVTPDNILLSHEGFVRLGGLSRARPLFQKITEEQGPPSDYNEFEPPHQAPGITLDVYSLGICLFEMDSGLKWPEYHPFKVNHYFILNSMKNKDLRELFQLMTYPGPARFSPGDILRIKPIRECKMKNFYNE
ncbi:hypothetical protein EIN_172350 [Entamoeba invadens IP1]|uniref:Protein kinase domain-containing protein n=1 Tax=Entamoeba invadens IP1 TaxID=370355 RepID=A0A0A1TYH9_ENTIV|nr:hypothetical protein EIN_172350 [Entamoeba invadens IP1]ELP84610.1 hypothetical protein EIN_172350 [Entamoeba invadens IP1]|eukprot:XP_004183956.1 hypothetical protein EIN_172350 [Entamoeba invadens IP1]